MPFDFRIVFSGICAFTPDPAGSFDEPKNRKGFFKKVTVVLPELITAGGLGNGGVRDGHIPTLELDQDLGWRGDRKVDLIAPNRLQRKDVFFLNKERIWFEFEGGDPVGVEVLNFDEIPSENPIAPSSPEQQKFFWWVPKMERVAQGSEKLREGLLSDDFETVAALVELRQGRLSVPEDSISKNPVEFKSDSGNGEGLIQKIAFRVALDVKQVTSVDILFQKRNELGQRKTRNLSLQGKEGQVEIVIKNREVQELLGVPVPKITEGGDVDFHTYYDLAAQPVPERLLPHEIAPPVFGEIGPASNKIGGVCPPTVFNGTAAAVLVEPQAEPQDIRKAAATAKWRRSGAA